MKNRNNCRSKTKTSSQKTTSSLLNIKTQRNSIASDSLALYYNDSLLSIRTASLHKSSQKNKKQKTVKSTQQLTANKK
jgi:hypothetical protein